MNNELDLLKNFLDRPIAFNPIYARITGSVTAGLVLSQLLYWWKTMNYSEFYKTDEDFSQELAMGIYELRGAKSKLLSLGLVIIKRKGIPAKTFYQINIQKLMDLITSFRKFRKQELGKTQNLIMEKPKTNTKNNTKNKQIYIEVLDFFNKTFSTGYKSYSFGSNLDYWLETYTIDDIQNAILAAKKDEFWRDKMTPTILFRKKNQNKEDTDRIGSLLNKSKPKNSLSKYK